MCIGLAINTFRNKFLVHRKDLIDIYFRDMKTFPENDLCKNVHSNLCLHSFQLKNPKCPYMNKRIKRSFDIFSYNKY